MVESGERKFCRGISSLFSFNLLRVKKSKYLNFSALDYFALMIRIPVLLFCNARANESLSGLLLTNFNKSSDTSTKEM